MEVLASRLILDPSNGVVTAFLRAGFGSADIHENSDDSPVIGVGLLPGRRLRRANPGG
jgi:hypothetical protein